MKTIEQAIKESGIPPKLIRSVIRQLGGKESLQDIANHGIDGGFPGFIYYTDTIAFYKRHRKLINQMVNDMAGSLGEDPLTMVENFNCLRPAPADKYALGFSREEDIRKTRDSIIRCLGGGSIREEDTQVVNALAWFAGEEVADAFMEDQ